MDPRSPLIAGPGGPGADNRALAQRRAAAVRALGDFPDALAHRTLRAFGNAAFGPQGPVDSPVVSQPTGPVTAEEWLRRIHALLEQMPLYMTMAWRASFSVRPREAVSFWVPGTVGALAAATSAVICSFRVSPKYTGFIEKIGLSVDPPASYASVGWSLQFGTALANSIHPYFSNLVLAAPTNLNTPFDFLHEIVEGQVINLVARNNAAGPVACSGIITGWTEKITSAKAYGSTPSTGIS